MDVVSRRPNQGWIEVITGSMFSGKSEELIRRLRRAQIARQRVQVFKPQFDDRYADDHIVSHSDIRLPSTGVRNAHALLEAVHADTEVVGIDEGQFFDLELPMICNTLADSGKRVIVAGLDQDYLGKPFEPMPQLLAIAEYITKTLASVWSPTASASSLARRAPTRRGAGTVSIHGWGRHERNSACGVREADVGPRWTFGMRPRGPLRERTPAFAARSRPA